MLRIIWFLMIIGLSVSCGSDRQELFIIDNEVEFELPTGLNTIETHVFVIKNVPTFYESNLSTFGYVDSDIVSIGSARATLTGSFQNVDYDFIDRISVRALSQTNPGLNKEMFYREDIPFSHNGDLRLLSSISELKEILSQKFIDLEVRIRIRNFTTGDIRNKLIFSYAVFDSE